MGREIEIKIPLTDKEYDKIFSVITGAETLSGLEVLGQPEHLLKSDIYFSRYENREERKAAGEPQVIRIRSEAGVEKKAFFCIKRKTIENGIELKERDIGFSLLWGKDEAYALGK